MGKKNRKKKQEREQRQQEAAPVADTKSPALAGGRLPRWVIPVALLVIAGIVFAVVNGIGGSGDFDETHEVLETFPHSRESYTQGLEWHRGFLFESAGRKGESGWGIVDHRTGDRLYWQGIGRSLFGEGITILDGRLYQVTYTSGKAFVYDLAPLRLEELDPAKASKADFESVTSLSMKPKRRFDYRGQGWGLTNDGTHLIMSNGQPDGSIVFRDPKDFSIVRSLKIKDRDGNYQKKINELEWIGDGIVLANIWQEDVIVRIDLEKEEVVSRIDMSGLLDESERAKLKPNDQVLNGIARHPELGVFVTGKDWPHLFRVRFEEK